MATKRRPPLYAFEAGPRRRRRRLRAPVSLLRLLVVVLLVLVAAAAGVVVVLVLPLTDRGAGVVSGADVRWGPALTAKGAPPAGLWSVHVSHRRIAGVSARAAVVLDGRSGRVLWGHAAHRPLPVASLTKLMTALLVERSHGSARFRVTAAMTGAPGASLGLRAGERVSRRRLLAAMLIVSANDAADALAVHAAGSVAAFVRRMNRQARAWHLRDTHFSNPSGIIDAGNRSSAWDAADLARRLLARPRLAALVGAQVFPTGPTSQYVNLNRLLWTYPGAIGVKTGSTSAAGDCIAAAARDGRRTVVAVLLHVHGDQWHAAARLLDWGFHRLGRRSPT